MLQYPQRRFFRARHCLNRQIKSLLQQVLPRKGRMRNMVGLDNPATACWKTDFSGSYILLVGIVALHEIVQLQHEMVIQGAAAFCDAKHLSQPCATRYGTLNLGQKMSSNIGKRFADAPDSILPVRIDIAKKPQNAFALIRTRRKGVYM